MDHAVLDPLPIFRLGVLAALGGGRDLASMADLTSWLTVRPSGVLLLTVDDDADFEFLASLQQYPDVLVVAVLRRFTVTTAARALRAGAVHVVPRDAEPQTLRDVVTEVEAGMVRLTLSVLRAATARHASERTRADPSDDEIKWLRALAAGRTVAAVAAESDISERRLYRQLNELYRRFGVSNRTQALMIARDEGWL